MGTALLHVVLGIVLTGLLAFQARVLVIVLRSRRPVVATRRSKQITQVVWAAIPVVVVLVLAVRDWILAFALASSGMVGIELAGLAPAPLAIPLSLP